MFNVKFYLFAMYWMPVTLNIKQNRAAFGY